MSTNQKLQSILCCPKCHHDLDFGLKRCSHCAWSFLLKDGVMHSITVTEGSERSDWLNISKEKIRKISPSMYRFFLELLAPVYSQFSVKKFLKSFPEASGKKIVNLGAGVSFFREDVLNVDLAPYQGIDLVADLESLPLRNDSVDVIINISVLEHVKEPSKSIKEFQRILKPGGVVVCFIPFLQGFHAAPNDFQRYTGEGMKFLFKDFHIQELIPIGPTSALLWTFQEWLALALSFSFVPLYRFLFLLGLVLSPLKYLDMVFSRYSMAGQIASGHYAILRKKS